MLLLGSLWEHRAPVPNWDLWNVRADRTELVTSLPAQNTLKRGPRPLFSSNIQAAVDHQVLLCVVWQLTPPLQFWVPSDGHSKLPASVQVTHLTFETSTQFSSPVLFSEVHAHLKQERTQRKSTALWHCLKTGSQHYASRQTKIWTHWHYANGSVWLVLTWLHTTLLISITRYSNGCWVGSVQLEQSRKNSQSKILIVSRSSWQSFKQSLLKLLHITTSYVNTINVCVLASENNE